MSFYEPYLVDSVDGAFMVALTPLAPTIPLVPLLHRFLSSVECWLWISASSSISSGPTHIVFESSMVEMYVKPIENPVLIQNIQDVSINF